VRSYRRVESFPPVLGWTRVEGMDRLITSSLTSKVEPQS
jgi:hypothetical protein